MEDQVTYLWHLFCKGDERAFEQLIEICYRPLFRYGSKFTDDDEVIKDSLQDLFLSVWNKRDAPPEVTHVFSYLFQALRYILIRHQKQEMRFSQLDLAGHAVPKTYSPEAEWVQKEIETMQDKHLQKAINLLPERQREALYLRYYEDLSYEEIGKIMGLQRQAVANYLQRGIQRLREYWDVVTVTVMLLMTVAFRGFIGLFYPFF
jgi:RNA polymerase sigma factor (sigma-70 family)